MLRSIIAVVAGFFLMGVLVTVSTMIAVRTMMGIKSREEMIRMTPTPAYVTVNLIFSGLFAILGGYVTAYLAPSSPMVHAAVLAALMFIMGLVSWRQNLQQKTNQGTAYSGTLVILGPVCALIGAWLHSMI